MENNDNVFYPYDILQEKKLPFDFFGYAYQFSLKDKIYFSRIQNHQLKDRYLNNLHEDHSSYLAGDLSEEFRITDTSTIDLIKSELLTHLVNIEGRMVHNITLSSPEKPNSHEEVWVNFQKKNEFNPRHQHTGVLSFVMYVSLPEEIREEHKNAKGNTKTRGLIQFSSEFTNDSLNLNPCEGDILIFQSSHMHQVYPFYSDATRITIAGNITGWDYV